MTLCQKSRPGFDRETWREVGLRYKTDSFLFQNRYNTDIIHNLALSDNTDRNHYLALSDDTDRIHYLALSDNTDRRFTSSDGAEQTTSDGAEQTSDRAMELAKRR